MNTIKFADMYESRTETHNVEIYGQKILNINDVEYIIDSHSQIMIYPTIKCNADCDFCLNKFDNTLCNCKENLTEEQYMSKLNKVFETLKELKPYISICGGEPSLSPLTVKILKLAKSHSINHRIFATNGSGLLNRYDGVPLLQHMKENNAVNNINIITFQ
jgi:MoaA/NifB/PqqE/SkfB family radical SAM enzyme